MATAKQIAARKLFAERSRAGTLKRGTKKRAAEKRDTFYARPGSGVEAAEASMRLARKHATRGKVKKNPVKRQSHRYPTARAVFDVASENMNRSYRGYSVVFNAIHNLYFVSKDGHHITSGGTRADVERQIDELLDGTTRKANPSKPARKKNPLIPGLIPTNTYREKLAFGYYIQWADMKQDSQWETTAGFMLESDAKQYAKAYARMWKNRTVRVIDNFPM